MKPDSLIYVAGHRGLVGSALIRRLEKQGYGNFLTRTSKELDLRDQAQVEQFFKDNKPEYVFLAAAKVGGILANATYPADFLRDNLLIQTNVIDAAYRHDAEKLLFLGSSCIYPKLAPQPMTEDCLLSGPLEPTNEWYAIAKISGLKMCAAYKRQYGFNAISVMPTNLYGPNDNYDLENSHVVPALMRKCHEAKEAGESFLEVWGTGAPRREFLYVDDMADACIHLMNNYDGEQWVNIGVGEDVTIRELAEIISDVVGFEGTLSFNTDKPDGTPQKLLDVGKLHSTGWRSKIGLREGVADTYEWYKEFRTQNG
ncbi:GDP-L-fucose synthase [Desulfovibrio sp. JC010]|uniref:GDP-L-fucose synthase n=1 Tax=Desulfovibrio sp. JC010 TaxID=2593641 RepID=UPI0013D72DE1|nr:GDP-L-fucose synthase [Desulfovibrio sp. JC010]NDV26676.1 GDP-L-fucose synthase [Desulfovibrio sp. JC010]